MKNEVKDLMPKWEFKPYFADSWVLIRDEEEVGYVYKNGRESFLCKEVFLLFEKRVSKEEFDEFLLKAAGMIVDWKYDSVSKKYQAIVSKAA